MAGGDGAQGRDRLGAVQVQDVEAVPAGQADVGQRVAGPPGQHPGPIRGGLGEAMGDEAAQGVLADLPAGPVPTGAAGPHLGRDDPAVIQNAGAVEVGEWVVQRQDRDPPAGVAEGGIPQQRAGSGHGRARLEQPARPGLGGVTGPTRLK
jgi:hypothetical protein